MHTLIAWQRTWLFACALVLAGLGVAVEAMAAERNALQRLAQAGDVTAQVRLGQRSFEQKDYQAALHWFRLAADQGNAEARNGVGTLYDNGKGVTRDFREAARWFFMAADQGHFMARRNLGWMHEKGQGFAVDMVQAYKWFHLAEMAKHKKNAAHDDEPIPCHLCDAVARKMTPEQIHRARELAERWRPGSR